MKRPVVLYSMSAKIADWVAERIPHVGSTGFGPSAALGIANGDGNRLLAGVVFHDFQPDHGTVQMSFAAESPLWAHKDVIREFLHYPFNEMRVYKVWTATPADNTAALSVNRSAGFTREAILAHQFGRKRHAVICRMLQPDYHRIYES